MLNGAQVRRALFRSLPPSFHVPSLLFSSPVGGGRGGLLRFSAPKMDRSIYRRMASLPPSLQDERGDLRGVRQWKGRMGWSFDFTARIGKGRQAEAFPWNFGTALCGQKEFSPAAKATVQAMRDVDLAH